MPDKCTYGWNFSKIQKPLCSEDVPIYETKEKQKCLKNSQNHHHKGVVHVEKPSQRTRRSRQISDLGLPPLPIWAFLKTHWIRDGMVLLCYGPSYQHWLIVKNKSLWDGTFPSSRPNSKTLILIFEKLKCFNGCHFCLVYQSGNSYYAMWSMHMVFCYSS